MTRKELKERIDKLMRQYADEEIDGVTYAQRMMELTASAQNETDSSVNTSCAWRTRDSRNIKNCVAKKCSKTER